MKRILTLALSLALIPVLTSSGCTMFSRAMNKSGTIFVIDVAQDGGDAADRTERSVKIIQSRLDATGMDGEVSPAGANRLEVRIFGSPDLSVARNFLFKTYRLEFRKVVSPPNPQPAAMYPDEAAAKSAAGAGNEVMPYSERGETSKDLILERHPIVTGEHIRSADAISRTGSDIDNQISFSLNGEGASKLADWTAKNINNYLAVVLNGKVESVAFIRSQIFDSGEISGMFSKGGGEYRPRTQQRIYALGVESS